MEDVLIILVIYEMNILNSQSCKSLLECWDDDINLLIYDNSSESKNETILNEFFPQEGNVQYVWDPSNPGIAKAYNIALQYANKSNMRWLLLLDQDSSLTTNFFHLLIQTKKNVTDSIVSIIPKVKCNKKIISPQIPFLGGFAKSISQYKYGAVYRELVYINSMSLVRISFLNQIGGFSEAYPLDMLDYYINKCIYRSNKGIYIIPVIMEHNLSVLQKNYVKIERYRSMLEAEIKFYQASTLMDKLMFKMHLILRSFKFWIKNRNKYASITLKKLFSLF